MLKKKKMLGTYTLMDFPPAPVQEIMNNMLGPILAAVNRGAKLDEVAQIPLGSMASILRTIYTMTHQYEYMLNVMAKLKDQTDLEEMMTGAVEGGEGLYPMGVSIWRDYLEYKASIEAHEKKKEEETAPTEPSAKVEAEPAPPIPSDQGREEFDKILDGDWNDV